MAEVLAEDGCPAFAVTVPFDDGQAGQRVQWGVRLDGPAGANAWGIMTEVQDPDSQQRHRELTLPGPGGKLEEPAIPLRPTPGGIWESDPVADFAAYAGVPYLFRLRSAQGQLVYRTDIHSRWQAGRGSVDPAGAHGMVIRGHWTARSAAAWWSTRTWFARSSSRPPHRRR
jgi:hypothetical protein